jgi:hypothetical protein
MQLSNPTFLAVFVPEKMQKKWVICELLMREAKS